MYGVTFNKSLFIGVSLPLHLTLFYLMMLVMTTWLVLLFLWFALLPLTLIRLLLIYRNKIPRVIF
jgi:hypothetical protein